MRRRLRRVDNDRQLELADWSPRECQSTLHRGNKVVPVDQFVRNGTYLRTCCRLCWAEQNRTRRNDDQPKGMAKDQFIDINRLWRPPTDHGRNARRYNHRRAGSGTS